MVKKRMNAREEEEKKAESEKMSEWRKEGNRLLTKNRIQMKGVI